MRAISECFRDKELVIKRYINSPSLLFLLLHAAQVVNEVKDSSDARELLLGSILQADMLTHVVNKRITAEHAQQRPSEDTATSKCYVESGKHSISIAASVLTNCNFT